MCAVPGEELFVCCALEEFVTGRPLLEEQSLIQILKSQCPTIFTRLSQYGRTGENLVPEIGRFEKQNLIPERKNI